MNLKVTNPYLWILVSVNSSQVKLHLYVEGEKIQEIEICLGKRSFILRKIISPLIRKNRKGKYSAFLLIIAGIRILN